MEEQAMCAFCCSPNGKKACRPRWWLSRLIDGLARRGWAFGLTTFDLNIGPFEIAFPLDKVRPDHLNRGGDECGGTDCQPHRIFPLSTLH
jgi:hypothetical protein